MKKSNDGDVTLMRKLIAKGADISIKDFNGKMALDYAIESNNEEMIHILRAEMGKRNQ